MSTVRRAGHAVAMTAVLVGLIGCSAWRHKRTALTTPLLRSPVSSADSVTLEVFFARLPADVVEQVDASWQEIDEQALPVLLRQRLSRNGFRAGLAEGNLPLAMARVLKLQDKPSIRSDGVQMVDVRSEPTVRKRLLQLRDGQQGYIAKSEIRDEITALWYRNGQLQGRSFHKAQCMFAVTTFRQGDGRVRCELVPEIDYGQAKQQYTGARGVFRVQFSRPKEVFSDLAIRTVLAPGHMLVLGGRRQRPGSIGQHFFSGPAGQGEEEKLLVIRFLHTNPGDPYAADVPAHAPR